MYVICLVSKCLRNFLQYKIISPDMIPVLGLDGCLQGLLKKLTAGLADFINKDGTSHLLLFVELLDKLFVWSRSKEHSTFVVCELIRKLMPSKLFSLLFDVAFDKVICYGQKKGLIYELMMKHYVKCFIPRTSLLLY